MVGSNRVMPLAKVAKVTGLTITQINNINKSFFAGVDHRINKEIVINLSNNNRKVKNQKQKSYGSTKPPENTEPSTPINKLAYKTQRKNNVGPSLLDEQ